MPAMARESFEESFSEKQQPLTLDRVWGLGDQRIVDAARVSIAGREVRPTSDNEKLLRYLLVNRWCHAPSRFSKIHSKEASHEYRTR